MATSSQPTPDPEPTPEPAPQPEPAPVGQKAAGPRDESATPAPGEGWPDGEYPTEGIFGYIVTEAQEV